jgi:hypothetical protein
MRTFLKSTSNMPKIYLSRETSLADVLLHLERLNNSSVLASSYNTRKMRLAKLNIVRDVVLNDLSLVNVSAANKGFTANKISTKEKNNSNDVALFDFTIPFDEPNTIATARMGFRPSAGLNPAEILHVLDVLMNGSSSSPSTIAMLGQRGANEIIAANAVQYLDKVYGQSVRISSRAAIHEFARRVAPYLHHYTWLYMLFLTANAQINAIAVSPDDGVKTLTEFNKKMGIAGPNAAAIIDFMHLVPSTLLTHLAELTNALRSGTPVNVEFRDSELLRLSNYAAILLSYDSE